MCVTGNPTGPIPIDWSLTGKAREKKTKAFPYLNAEGVTSVQITEQHTLILKNRSGEETPVDVGISDKPTERERRGV